LLVVIIIRCWLGSEPGGQVPWFILNRWVKWGRFQLYFSHKYGKEGSDADYSR
jgi:hypothetical protein